MNFAILLLTSRLAQLETKIWRIFVGSILGAVYSLLFFIISLDKHVGFIWKVFFSLVIIAIVFAPSSWRKLGRATVYFYLISFVFGGAVLALSYFIDFNGLIKRGINVFDFSGISWWILLLALGIVLLVSNCFWHFYNTKLREKHRLSFTIGFAGKTIALEGLVDTGNQLQAPLSRLPVIIAEYESVRSLFSPELCNIFEQFNNLGDSNTILNLTEQRDWIRKLRIIPYSSLGRKKGMMLGFKPDYVLINHNEQIIKTGQVVIAICSRHLSLEGNYKALVHPDLIVVA